MVPYRAQPLDLFRTEKCRQQYGTWQPERYPILPKQYGENDPYYYVGSKTTAKEKVSRGCTIRQVRAESELSTPDLLFSMMAVDFVRNGQYTVIPFPIKYLREHFTQCGFSSYYCKVYLYYV